jgi:peptidoglycan/LPS O-acetylase OafA/YrhL
MHRSETEWLHGLRGFAVLIVIAGHLSALKMNIVPGLDLTGISKTGVWLFFVLSAYLLARPLAEDVARHDVAAIGAFYIRRIFRIVPLYFVALYYLVHTNQLTAAQGWMHAKFEEGHGYLWTMPVEMAFYFFLPLFAFVGGNRAAVLVLGASLIVYIGAGPRQLGDNSIFFANYGVIFAFGILIAYAPRPSHGGWTALAGLAMMALTNASALTAMFPLTITGALTLAPLNAFGCALLLHGASASPAFQAVFAQSWIAWLGRVSFGAYLAHMPITLALRAFGAHPALRGLMVCAIIVAAASLAHFVIEQPMNRLGHWLAQRLTSSCRRASRPSPPRSP